MTDDEKNRIDIEEVDRTPKMGGAVASSGEHERVDTQTMSEEHKKEYEFNEDEAVFIKTKKTSENRAQSSNFAKRPLVATTTANKMLHTMSTGLNFPERDLSNEHVNSSNALDFANRTQVINAGGV